MALPATSAQATPEQQIPLGFRLPFLLRNMVRRWRKSVGATVGVAIALGVVATLIGISSGATNLLAGEYLVSQADIYAVSRGGVITPIFPGDSPGTISNARLLLSQIRAVPGVRTVVGTIGGSLPRDKERNAQGRMVTEPWPVYGVYGDASEIPGMLDLRTGRWPRTADEVFLGTYLASVKELKAGDSVTLGNKRMRVVGTGRLRGVGYGGTSAAYLPFDTFRDVSGLGDVISVIMIDTSGDTGQVMQRVQSLRDIDVQTQAQVYQKIMDLANVDVIFYYLVAALALAIAALSVANILTMSMAERRLEFATLRAIGVRRRTILLLVISESMTIALLGYVAGVIISLVLGFVIDYFYAPLARVDQLFYPEPALYIRVFVVAVLLGALAGLFPARAALKVQPADVLREA